MTTVRRINDGKSIGYGVDGVASLQNGTITRVGIESYLADIPYATGPDIGASVTFNYAVVSMRWRYKVIVNDADLSRITVFNARTGKAKYGDLLVGYREYYRDDCFLNYTTYISALYGCKYLISLPSAQEEDIPCDEPPLDIGLTLSDRSFTQYATGSSFSQVVLTDQQPGITSCDVGSNFTYVPSDSSIDYGWGLTYAFTVGYMDTDTFIRNNPVVVGI